MDSDDSASGDEFQETGGTGSRQGFQHGFQTVNRDDNSLATVGFAARYVISAGGCTGDSAGVRAAGCYEGFACVRASILPRCRRVRGRGTVLFAGLLTGLFPAQHFTQFGETAGGVAQRIFGTPTPPAGQVINGVSNRLRLVGMGYHAHVCPARQHIEGGVGTADIESNRTTPGVQTIGSDSSQHSGAPAAARSCHEQVALPIRAKSKGDDVLASQVIAHPQAELRVTGLSQGRQVINLFQSGSPAPDCGFPAAKRPCQH